MALPICPLCKATALVRTSGPFTVVVCPRSACKNTFASVNANKDKALAAFGTGGK